LKTIAHPTPTPDYAFGPFRLLATQRRLLRDGETVAIGSRAFDILMLLVERAGEVVSKKTMVARVWPDTVVEESNLRVHMVALRKVLGDGMDGARFIENVPGRGYSFVAPVSSPTSPPAPAGQPSADSRPVRSAPGLPARLARMMGRDSAVAALCTQVREHRFITIAGPGGLGKTTVAVAVAHALSAEFPNVFFVDLTAVADAAGVANGLASTLGLTVRKEDPTPEILAYLGDTSALLVLDNCEHVVEAIGRLAERIFIAAPSVHILATSREILNVEGESVYALDSLATPDHAAGMTAEKALGYAAIQLFVERAGAAGNPMAFTDADAPVVADICRRLDGIALAVELAAGRVGAFGIRGTAELLEKRFGLEWRGRRTALVRHQTLNATLDWSYGLLAAAEQEVLQRLSVFAGDFTLPAALAIAGEGERTAGAVIEAIASLVSKSLVSMRVADAQPRYRLLEMVRAYAAVKLADGGGAALVHARHARYFAQRCREAEAPDSTAVEMRDVGNIRAALEWSASEQGDAEIARDLSIAAAPILLRWSLLAECRRWSARAMESLREADRGTVFEARLIRTLAISTMFTVGNKGNLSELMTRGLELARSSGDARGEFEFLVGAHAFSARTGNFDGAVAAATDAATVANPAESASGRWMQCLAHHMRGEPGIALAHSEQALLLQPVPTAKRRRYFGYDQRTPGLAVRARVLWLMGDTQAAIPMAAQAIAEGVALKHPVSCCLTLLYATSVFLWSARWAEAEESIDLLADTSANYLLEPYFAGGQMLKGELLHARGDPAGAIPLLSDAVERLNRERQVAQAPYCAAILADAYNATSRFSAALETLEPALGQRRAGGGSFDMPELLRIRAASLLGMSGGNPGSALESLREAVDLARRQGALGWALRSALALSALQPEKGREIIAELLPAFPAGAHSVDLAAARKMLPA
jgi:predicted ATPase/DNA-binding winged helix-turn-helix (wHTH) protein